ncbi:DUF4333 domain-containing protein [Streptomyces sp. NPDC045456]|uniref:DUF4333 domain-containing protein n=1 Tax=Streptomyces sp. NPDC045456 TaxID=3155254 RepID=UPI0033F79355
MKRIIIALAVIVVLAAGGGIALSLNTNNGGAVLTASGAGHEVPRADVEENAKGHPFRGEEPDSVSCPSGLRAKEAESVRCTAVYKGRPKSMTISVTEVQDDQVTVDFAILDKSTEGAAQGAEGGAGKSK